MTGMYNIKVKLILKIVILSLFTFSIWGCGKRTNYPEKIELLSDRQSNELGEKELAVYNRQIKINTQKKEEKNLKASRFLDLDQDGIVDAYDSDIDNDNVHNLADSHPFDSSRGSEDQDNDTIPDFVDFNSIHPEYAALQENIYTQKDILVICESIWSNGDIFTIMESIQSDTLLFHRIKSLNIIKLSEKNKPRRAEYNVDWKTISLFSKELTNNKKLINNSFFHELFHVLAIDYPTLYNTFLKVSPWIVTRDRYGNKKYSYKTKDGREYSFTSTSLRFDDKTNYPKLLDDVLPSLYSLQGPSEHFAEAGLATYVDFLINKDRFSLKRFKNLELFKKTQMYKNFLIFLNTKK